MKRVKVIFALVVLLQITAPAVVWCDDLDDGISGYTDDSIKKWDELGKKDRNVTFIKMNARSKAAVQQKSGEGLVNQSGSGTGANMNSVVMGAGSTVKGDIIIIDDSKGDKTLVSE